MADLSKILCRRCGFLVSGTDGRSSLNFLKRIGSALAVSKEFEMIEGWHRDSVEVVRIHWERILKLNLSVSFTVIVPPATEGALMP